MEEEVLFEETQRFTQKWIWILLIAIVVFVSGPTIVGFVKQLFLGQPFGNKPMSNSGVVILTIFNIIIPAIPIYLFAYMKLETVIKKEGIYVRFFPFVMKDKFYGWNDLNQCYVRQYHPVGEFGGWGMKGFGKNRALNVSGNMGIQLETKDGYRMLIGTNKPQEVEEVLRKLKQYVGNG